MSKNIRNWENWDVIENDLKEEEVRDKINHKPKHHDINEWHKVIKELDQKGKYKGWHSVEGIASNDKVCVKGEVQIFLRKR